MEWCFILLLPSLHNDISVHCLIIYVSYSVHCTNGRLLSGKSVHSAIGPSSSWMCCPGSIVGGCCCGGSVHCANDPVVSRRFSGKSLSYRPYLRSSVHCAVVLPLSSRFILSWSFWMWRLLMIISSTERMMFVFHSRFELTWYIYGLINYSLIFESWLRLTYHTQQQVLIRS